MSWITDIFTSKDKQLINAVNKAQSMKVGSPQYFSAVIDAVNKYVDSIDNKTEIKNGYMLNDVVYSCVRYIARKAAAVPWLLYEVKNDKDFKRFKSLDYGAKKDVFRAKALEEVEDHALLDLLDRPNPLQGKQEFFEALIGYKLVTGNSYLHTVDLSRGSVAEMYVLPADKVHIKIGNQSNPIEGYYVHKKDGHRIFFDPETVCHFRYWNPDGDIYNNALYGLSPIMAGRKAIQMNNDGTQAMAKMFANMGVLGMFVLKNGENVSISREQAKKLEDDFYQNWGSPNNAGKVKFSNADWEWQNVGMSPVDLAILQAKEASKRDICMLFGLPSVLFNDNEQSTYNNMKEAKKDGFINAIKPELTDIRDEFNRFLVPKFGIDTNKYYLDLDWAAVEELSEDMKMITEIAERSWWLTPDERRAMQYFEPLEDSEIGSGIYIPSNLIKETGEVPPIEE